MIEVREVVNAPTENDLKNVFTDLFGQAKVMQGLLADVLEEYVFKHGIDCNNLELSVSPNMLTLRMGEYLLFHETKEWVAKVG